MAGRTGGVYESGGRLEWRKTLAGETAELGYVALLLAVLSRFLNLAGSSRR